jgi:hypothetical protein
MRGFLFDMSSSIIYATGLVWLVAGVYTGVQVLSLMGEFTRGMIAGVILIVAGVLAAALHCLICFAILDIRSYTRHAAKYIGTGRG